MKFTCHAVLGTLQPGGIRVYFQGKAYDLRAGRMAGNIDVIDTGIVSSRVEKAYVRKASVLVDLSIRDTKGNISVISGTPEHPFYVPAIKAYVEMGKLTPGTVLKTDDGQEATVTASKIRNGEWTVYNLKVPETHNYYLSSPDGGPKVLVHNAPRPSMLICTPAFSRRPVKSVLVYCDP